MSKKIHTKHRDRIAVDVGLHHGLQIFVYVKGEKEAKRLFPMYDYEPEYPYTLYYDRDKLREEIERRNSLDEF